MMSFIYHVLPLSFNAELPYCIFSCTMGGVSLCVSVRFLALRRLHSLLVHEHRRMKVQSTATSLTAYPTTIYSFTGFSTVIPLPVILNGTGPLT